MNRNIPKLLSFITIAALLFLTACKTYEYFDIEILEPAELFFPPDMQSLVIAHNIFPTQGDTIGKPFMIYGQPGNDSVYIDTALAMTAIHSLAGMMNFAGRFTVVVEDSLKMTFPKSVEEYTLDDLNYIRKLCESWSSDGLILLNEMEHSNSYDVFVSKSGGYLGEFETTIKTEWLFINPFISKLIDKKIILDTVYFQVEPLNIDGENNGFEARKEALNQASSLSSNTYGQHISPHYVQTSRMIFKKGDKNIKTGYQQAQLGNWKNAAYFWRNALSSPEQKTQALAGFNLALASEMEGLLEPALEWAKDSYRYFPDTLNATYISILRERIKQQEDLILQMGDGDAGK